jgi:2-(1,2-epoxy-1,2-dihydrophenyl)acetyl-CoA isomerase
MEHVTLDVANGVATVTIDHPEVRNALTGDVARELVAAMDSVPEDARCVVIAGNGPTFCAGGDVNAMVESVDSDAPAHELARRIVEETAGAVRAVATCDLPTVAKIHGPAYGAGGALAVACDVLLASEEAKISFGFRQVGLNVDSGASYFLPRMVGEHVAKELVYTGELIDADRAEEVGLFNRVYPTEEFDERVAAFVERVATGPTVALRQSKRLIEAGLDSSLDEAIENEAAAQVISGSTDDHVEGVTAFVESRDPEFEGE